MAKGRHKPPSRIKYEQNNPTISFRVSREVYEKLKDHLAKRQVSFADFVKESLGVQKPLIEKRDKAWNEGYDQAEEDYQIRYPCSKCGEGIGMLPGSSLHNSIMEFLKEKGFKHLKCP